MQKHGLAAQYLLPLHLLIRYVEVIWERVINIQAKVGSEQTQEIFYVVGILSVASARVTEKLVASLLK